MRTSQKGAIIREVNLSGESSIYEIEFSERRQYAILEESADTDIAIIGGGLTGISAALHLAENGYSAMVLEAGKLGTGGSGRNGGHVCQGWPNDFYQIQRQLSEQDAKVAWDSGMAAVNLVKDRVDRYKIDCELTFGYVEAAYHKRQMESLDEMQREWEARGYDAFIRLEDRTALNAHVDTNAYVGGLFDSKSGHMQPLKYLHGLAAAAAKQGGLIYENTPIVKIKTNHFDGYKHLHTRSGQVVRAKILLLCGNAYLADVGLPSMKSRLAQVTSSVLATKPLSPNVIRHLMPTGAAVADCNAALNYYRIDAKGRMIFGGRASYTNIHFGDVEADLRRRMVKIFPILKNAEKEAVWSGKIGITVNRIPQFGRTPDDIYFVQGFSGHGVALTGQAGVMLAEAVIGDQTGFNVLSSLNHMPFPGGPLRIPALALGMAYYKLRDRLKI